MTKYSNGFASQGFENVADTFEELLSENPSMGAALAIRQDGMPVVDLWGGIADERVQKAWEQNTLNVIFSATKGLVSILAAKLVQEGLLDYEALVSSYWPEFAQFGKEEVRVRDLLGHRTGLPVFEEILTQEDALNWNYVTDRLELERPIWIPGEHYAYHALTFGWLIGEVIQRATKQSVGAYFETSIAKKLAVDAWIGLPPEEESRVSHLHATDSLNSFFQNMETNPSADDELFLRSLTLGKAFPPTLITPNGDFNGPRVHAAEIPGAGGIATARGLATIWSATITPTEGVRLLDDRTIQLCTQVVSEGKPFFGGNLPYPRFGMGMELGTESVKYLGSSSFGHDGAGGQCAFADKDHGIGFAFLTNQMDGPGDDRSSRIIEALKGTL